MAQAEVCKTFYTGSIPVAASNLRDAGVATVQAPEVRERGALAVGVGLAFGVDCGAERVGSDLVRTATALPDEEERERTQTEQHQQDWELRTLLLRLRVHLLERTVGRFARPFAYAVDRILRELEDVLGGLGHGGGNCLVGHSSPFGFRPRQSSRAVKRAKPGTCHRPRRTR